MNGKKARIFFVGTCLILAILLLTQVLTPIVGGIIFTVALIAFGVPYEITSNHESDGGACLGRRDGLRAVHRQAGDQVNERIGGGGRIHTQRDPRGPCVLF